jgi:eukaryotic-like serine/threonine-protein kinase
VPDTKPAPADYDPRKPPKPSEPLKPGDKPVEGYKLVELLGRGGFGEVWKATAGIAVVAMKFVPLSNDNDVGERELQAVRELLQIPSHPHVLVPNAAWPSPSRARLAIVMEHAESSLDKQANANVIPGPKLLDFLSQAAAGLDHLHENGLIHRDVKPHNLLLVNGVVKVADFGFLKAFENTITAHTGGYTPAYAAPEVFRGEVSKYSDQYALAVTYCVLRGGKLPFVGTQQEVMFGHLQLKPDLSRLPEAERLIVAKALKKN